VQDREHPLLWSSGLVATQLHWVAGSPPAEEFECHLRTRYRQTEAACRVQVQADGAVAISFREPQWAVTPGQYAVFYREEECLGGGAIDGSTAWADPSRATALSA
jgi:tRNA-specific 2-thiouridylase